MAKAPTLLYKMKEKVPVQSLFSLDPAIKRDVLLAGAEDGTVSEWNMNCLRKTETFRIGNTACLGLKTLGNILFTQDKLGSVKLWEPFQSNWTQTGVLQVDYSGFAKIDVTNNFGGLVACPSRFSIVSVFSVEECNRVMTLQRDCGIQSCGEVMALKFIDLAENSFLLIAFENGNIDLYDLKIKKTVSSATVEDCILSLDFHTDSMLGVCGTVGNQVHTFTINDIMELSITKHFDMFSLGMGVIKIIPHKKIVVIGGWDGIIRVCSWRNLNSLGGLKENCSQIHDIDFSANVMTTVDTSGRICFWNL